jgi:ubiquinone/menaquinone biosynthesis C-methylase UbiE
MLDEEKNLDKTQSFDGLAKGYDKSRPDYPSELFKEIINFWKEGVNEYLQVPVILDVGCGTGISTRAFYIALSGKCKITGIEPGVDMLETAIRSSPKEIGYIQSPAELLPVGGETVDIITAAQAAQWFKRPEFYKEAERVLKENGVIAIYENNRDWANSEFLNKHEEFLEEHSIDTKLNERYSRHYRDFPYQDELSGIFKNAKTFTFFWSRKMTPEGFLAMAKTSTQVKRAINLIGVAETERKILNNANSHTDEDKKVDIRYSTKLYVARK